MSGGWGSKVKARDRVQMSGFKRRTPPCFMPMTLKECFGSGAPYKKIRLACSRRKRVYVGAEPRQELLLERNVRKFWNAFSVDLKIRPTSAPEAAAIHPQPASYCLAMAGNSFLTSDPGIEGDAHTAVGVVGLHGNFPCTTGTVTEREGGIDVSCTLRPYVRPTPRPGCTRTTLGLIITQCARWRENWERFFTATILFGTHVVTHNIVLFTNLILKPLPWLLKSL